MSGETSKNTKRLKAKTMKFRDWTYILTIDVSEAIHVKKVCQCQRG